MSKKKEGGIGEIVRTVVYAMAIALFVRTIAYEPFNIPSGSMIPTLLVGDFLFVSKFSYGYSRHSLPWSLPLIPGRIAYEAPERGDVAVFKLPTDGRTDYIKRLVGLPGDEIQVRNGIVHINGKAVERERVEDFIVRHGGGTVQRIPQFVETLPNGRRHRILEASSDQGPFDNTPIYKVPEDHYFAMGDNRDNSRDSRFREVGFIPMENLVGRAEVLFFSIDGSVWQFWQWPTSIRFRRLFDSVD